MWMWKSCRPTPHINRCFFSFSYQYFCNFLIKPYSLTFILWIFSELHTGVGWNSYFCPTFLIPHNFKYKVLVKGRACKNFHCCISVRWVWFSYSSQKKCVIQATVAAIGQTCFSQPGATKNITIRLFPRVFLLLFELDPPWSFSQSVEGCRSSINLSHWISLTDDNNSEVRCW